MIEAIFKIRVKQIYRGLIGIGLFRLLFLLGLIGFGEFALFMSSSVHLTSQYISIGFLLQIILIHFKRGDKLFLRSQFPNYKLLMFSEYLVLSIPFVSAFLIHLQWTAFFEILAGLLIIVNLNWKTKHSSLNTQLQKLIPVDAFEWKAGLRKQFFIIVPIWTLAAATSFFAGSVPIAIFILGFLTISFFGECEPIQILQSAELGSKRLLGFKVKRQFQLFSAMVVPLIGLFLLFHPETWYIPILEYFILCCLHLYTILTKYAFYEPNTKPTAAHIFIALGAIGGIIPVFLPIIWLLSVRFYLKSVSNLNFFLNDYDQ